MVRLPKGVETVHLVDSEGRRWGTMSREEYEMETEVADLFKEFVMGLVHEPWCSGAGPDRSCCEAKHE